MKITKRLVAIGIASAATVATGLGVATTVDGASAAPRAHTLKFVAVSTAEHRTGPRTFVGTEVERHHGKVVGYDTLSGKFNLQTHKVFIWVAVARKGGQLLGHVTIRESSPHFKGKVTGGSGRFRGAKGVIYGRSPAHSNKTFVTIRYHF